jgi:exopolysaccharide biosynthesis polyprenyl glycosylphosphotransferase
MFKIFNVHISKWKVLLFLGDGVCFAISVILALRLNPYTSDHPWAYLQEIVYPILIIGLVYYLVLYIGDAYDFQQDYRQVMNFGRVLISCWAGAFWRFSFSTIALPQRLEKKLIIIGAGKSGRDLLEALREIPGNGFMPVGFVDDDGKKIGTEVDGLPVMGNSSELSVLIQKYQVSLLVLAVMREKSSALVKNLIQLSWSDCQLMDMPTLYEILTRKLPTEHISEELIFEWNINTTKIYYLRLKRFIDLMLSSILLIVTTPIMVLTAIVIKLDSKGPIFFSQERLGFKGKAFKIMKFRTMINDAVNCGPLWTTKNDPRITRVGRIIRKLRLDELPQLINILKGEMSFIGPRPLAHTSLMTDIPYYKYRLLVKPGITGWAQVVYPYGIEAETTPEKLKYDLYYIKNIGFLLDMAILLKTVRTVLFGCGV